MSNLPILNPQADTEEIRAALREGLKKTQEGLDKLGANLLQSLTTATTQSITSASFVPVLGLQGAANTSGGLITCHVKLMVGIPSAQTAVFQLLVDGVSKDVSAGSSSAGSLLGTVMLFWQGNLNAGNHTFKVQAKVDGGTLGLNGTTYISSMYITENLRG